MLKAFREHLASSATRATLSAISASLVGQLAQLVSGVASARLLGADLRGQLALLTMIPLVASQVAHLGVPSAITFFTARDPGRFASIARAGIRASLAASITGGLASTAIILVLGIAGATGGTFVILAATTAIVPLYVTQLVALASLQGRRLFLRLNVQRILPLILNAAGLVFLLAFGLRSIALAIVVLFASQAFATVVSVVSAGLTTGGGAQSDQRPILRFGLRGLPSTLSPIETFRADQFIVGIFFGTTALGYYAAATAFSVFPRLVAQAVGVAAFPYIASRRTPGEMARTARNFILASFGIIAIITLTLELSLPGLTELFFGREFLPAVGVGRLLLVGAAFMSCRRMVADCSRAIGRPELDSLSEVAAWPLLLGGLLILAPTFGSLGVAGTLVVAYSVATAIAVTLLARALRADGGRHC